MFVVLRYRGRVAGARSTWRRVLCRSASRFRVRLEGRLRRSAFERGLRGALQSSALMSSGDVMSSIDVMSLVDVALPLVVAYLLVSSARRVGREDVLLSCSWLEWHGDGE